MDEKDKNVADMDSDVERINSFVSSSEQAGEEKPAVEDLNEDKEELKVSEPIEEKPIEPVAEKPVEQVKKEKPVAHVKPHVEKKQAEPVHKIEHKVHHKPVTHETPVHKIHHKPAEHHIEKKPVHVVAHKPEHKKAEIKQQPHKVVVSKPAPKIVHVAHKVTQTKLAVKQEPKKVIGNVSKNNNIKNKKSLTEDNMTKENKKKFKLTKNTMIWIGIGVLAALLVVALILILSPKQQPVTGTNETAKSVAATVNGEAIYLQDVVKEYNGMDAITKSMYTVESVLNKSIGETLLYQEAKNSGIKASAEDVQAEIDALKTQNKLTDSDLDLALQKQGMTLDDLKNVITRNLVIRQYLNSTILQNITVTDNQIQTYYTLNIEKFKVQEQVTVQHILIAFGPNSTENETKAKIEQVNSELTNSNFCDLVTKYSQDPGSISSCGAYTFGRGQMVAEFENPSFSMKINETSIVRTVYGYHLIKKLASIPAHTLNVSDVYDQINKTVYGQIAQKSFDELIASLRAKAVIVNYLAKTDSNATTVTTLPKSLDDFAKCLTANGAKFYGASWCPHCENQKTMFGASLQYVTYVECAVEGQPQVQTKECTDAGITGYPTWIVNNQTYPGEQSLDKLAQLTGCTKP